MADSSSVNVTYVYLFSPTFQFMNISGKPLVDGYIEVYISGTRSKYYAYSDFDGTLHPFKIQLNALGSAVVLVSPAHSYDVYVYNSLGVLQMSRYNIIPATGDTPAKGYVLVTGSDGSIKVDTTSLPNGVQYDLSVNTDIIAAPFDGTIAYAVGDCVTYKSKLYRCTTAIVTPSSTWDPSNWTETSVDEVINAGSFATKEYVDSMLGNVEQLLSEL